MARYVGDLTDPKNHEEREKMAQWIEEVAVAVRDRKVRSLNLSYARNVTNPGVGIPRQVDPWIIEIEVTEKGRHEA